MYCMYCMQDIGVSTPCPLCGNRAPAPNLPHQLPQGMMLHGGDYLIGRVLGQGGFGITYLARDLLLDRRVAIKEFFPTGFANRNVSVSCEVTVTDSGRAKLLAKGKNRFLDEARALAQFQSVAGIVKALTFFEENQTAYIVMEYLMGKSLGSLIAERPIEPAELLSMMDPVMVALEKVHGKGVIHRDISPDNIMVLSDGSLCLMDFGAARAINLEGTRSVLVKEGYAPIEQYSSEGEQGPWTDIYALCATMYKAMTGIKPVDAISRQGKGRMAWPSELGVDIDPRFEQALKKGMAPNPEDRFQSISEFRASLGGESSGSSRGTGYEEPPISPQSTARLRIFMGNTSSLPFGEDPSRKGRGVVGSALSGSSSGASEEDGRSRVRLRGLPNLETRKPTELG